MFNRFPAFATRRCPRAQRRKRGFTLTEIAIVIGIIGAILGAIWVAAGSVYSNNRISQATTELISAIQGVRAIYGTSPTVDSGANMALTGAQSTGGLTYIQAGVFPANTLNTGSVSTATEALNPWNGEIAIQSATTSITGDSFQIAFDDVPQSDCANLIATNAGDGRDAGLTIVSTGAAAHFPSTNTQTPPVSPTQAAGLCALSTQAVSFTFTLH